MIWLTPTISELNFEVLFPFAIGMLVAAVIMPRIINRAYDLNCENVS